MEEGVRKAGLLLGWCGSGRRRLASAAIEVTGLAGVAFGGLLLGFGVYGEDRCGGEWADGDDAAQGEFVVGAEMIHLVPATRTSSASGTFAGPKQA